MGEHQAQAENEQLPNGLLPGAGHVMLALDTERWMKAEKRAVDLIACIQPNKLSEERRNAVADYVQRLIMKCFPCQVCSFGSVPLKTYLPDGDIDLTVLCQNQNLKDTWANLVKDILDSEEKNENAEFHVKEIQCIQAEVKIIKCLVENIVVDISFNQVGGLCTLCFLDEVDNLISQNHLFKHSIILIKAWCYYESRILGAHHGLISTYALETLVLYIFHVFNNAFLGPLEVLYRFLEFFSNFDWDNFCVSLWGPVPINCLPDVTAEPPRKDSGELLLSKLFLEACSSVYAVFPASQESNGQQFASKHFNVIDPLRVSNNLGRSVSKGNFFRIRSAFAFGAKRLARLLACPKDNLTSEVNQFFMNTCERHGSGHRPDAPVVDSSYLRLSAPDGPCEFWNSSNGSTRKKVKESSNTDRIEVQVTHTHGVSNQHGENSSRMLHMKSGLSSATRSHSLESQFNVNSLQVTDQIGRDAAPGQVVPNDKIQRDLTRLSADPSGNDTEERLPFARTHSSPELTDNCNDISSQVQGETRDARTTHSRLDSSYRRKNLGSQNLVSHSNHMSVKDTVVISQQSLDAADSNIVSNSFALSEEFSNSTGAQLMHQEDQDIANMMASASLQGFSDQIHVPFNLTSGHLPYSIPPSFLASVGYTQHSFPGFVPSNIPLMDPSLSHVQYPRSLVPPQYYFPGIGLNPSEGEQSNEFCCPMDSVEATSDSWKKQDTGSSCRYDLENGDLNTLSDEKPAASLSGLKYVPPPLRVTASSSGRVQHNHLRSRTSSESSCNRSSVKTSNSNKGKMGKKIPTYLINNQERGKVISRHVANDSDDDQEWGSLLNLGTEITGRHPGSESAPLHVSRHHMPDSDIAQTSGSDSTISFPPVLIDPGSRQRMDKNSGLMTFYPTGPPIPFLTMLPLYNVPPETRTSDASSPLARISTNESSKEQKADILSSDFVSHWQSLQFGRVCQNPRPLVYPSPIMVPPVYVNGQPPYDNPGRPLSTNTNMFSQLMTNDGNHLVPVAPLQSISNRHPNIYQSYMDNMPRYRSGTGTYLPNHKVLGSRRGNNNHDRNDNFSDREVIWNANSRSRTARNHNRNQTHKFNSQRERYSYEEDRSDQRWNSYMPSYQSQSGSLRSNFGEDGPQNVAYNINPNGVSNGPSVPPGMMMYPYHNAAYISNNGHLEFGSLGQVDIPYISDTRARTSDDSRLHGSSAHCSSPDQPSSPHHHSY